MLQFFNKPKKTGDSKKNTDRQKTPSNGSVQGVYELVQKAVDFQNGDKEVRCKIPGSNCAVKGQCPLSRVVQIQGETSQMLDGHRCSHIVPLPRGFYDTGYCGPFAIEAFGSEELNAKLRNKIDSTLKDSVSFTMQVSNSDVRQLDAQVVGLIRRSNKSLLFLLGNSPTMSPDGRQYYRVMNGGDFQITCLSNNVDAELVDFSIGGAAFLSKSKYSKGSVIQFSLKLPSSIEGAGGCSYEIGKKGRGDARFIRLDAKVIRAVSGGGKARHAVKFVGDVPRDLNLLVNIIQMTTKQKEQEVES